MKLFVWLWNPWDKYKANRHNVGYLMLEKICNFYNFEWFVLQSKFHCEINFWNIWLTKVIAIKPLTYMNLSWDSVTRVINFYKINPEDILVLQDDIDMDFWKIKLKFEWKAWWHNWIKDIEKKLWTQWFWRLKFWVWRPNNTNISVSDFVLSNFSSDEQKSIDSKMNEIILKVNEFISK